MNITKTLYIIKTNCFYLSITKMRITFAYTSYDFRMSPEGKIKARSIKGKPLPFKVNM